MPRSQFLPCHSLNEIVEDWIAGPDWVLQNSQESHSGNDTERTAQFLGTIVAGDPCPEYPVPAWSFQELPLSEVSVSVAPPLGVQASSACPPVCHSENESPWIEHSGAPSIFDPLIVDLTSDRIISLLPGIVIPDDYPSLRLVFQCLIEIWSSIPPGSSVFGLNSEFLLALAALHHSNVQM